MRVFLILLMFVLILLAACSSPEVKEIKETGYIFFLETVKNSSSEEYLSPDFADKFDSDLANCYNRIYLNYMNSKETKEFYSVMKESGFYLAIKNLESKNQDAHRNFIDEGMKCNNRIVAKYSRN